MGHVALGVLSGALCLGLVLFAADRASGRVLWEPLDAHGAPVSLAVAGGMLGHVVASTGIAPVAIQQELIRYWVRQDRPPTLETAPFGRVSIRRVGRDSTACGGRKLQLERVHVAAEGWHPEALWFEESVGVIALMGLVSAETLAAVRSDCRPPPRPAPPAAPRDKAVTAVS